MAAMSQRNDRAAVKARYEALCGRWPEMFDPVLAVDPELMDAFVDLSAVPVAGGRLDPVVREFIGIAVNASTTHMYEPAVREHIRTALSLGAATMEIVEVLELVSVLGIHSCELGMSVLATEVDAQPELDERRQAVRDRFLAGRGMFPEILEDVLRFDPELLEAYVQYSTTPWRRGLLPPKVKEFVYIAIDAATTKLYEVGTRIHMRNALAAGASEAEITEVLELISQIGIQACVMGIPVLLDEMAKAGVTFAPEPT